ncbi:MAG TPA: hypothetical protein K8V00_08280, partial [Ligilactobacillus acidipiscis]|nr:hypothetical protein [Ligilactobacillus acidipiscis]
YRIAGLETLCYIKMKKQAEEIKNQFLQPVFSLSRLVLSQPHFVLLCKIFYEQQKRHYHY